MDCGTGQSNLTGAMAIGTNGSINQFGTTALFSAVPTEALCLTAVTGNITGVIGYADF
jgi:hypothetical protein